MVKSGSDRETLAWNHQEAKVLSSDPIPAPHVVREGESKKEKERENLTLPKEPLPRAIRNLKPEF